MTDAEMETLALRATEIVTSIIHVISAARSGKLKPEEAHAKLAEIEAQRDDLREGIKADRAEADAELAKKFDHSDDK